MKCNLCPRKCNVDRNIAHGLCGMGEKMRIAKVMIHKWEEPCISGVESTSGSGAIFFSGCPLRCVYCQNRDISKTSFGKDIDPTNLANIFLDLQNKGAHNINLVTPTHFSDKIIDALDLVKGKLKIPVVYNTGGYELPEIIEKLTGYVQVFLTDIKYYSDDLSKKYSNAPDYFKYALSSLESMIKIAGECKFDSDGLIKSGVILRHLVLPTHRDDSIKVLDEVKKNIDISKIRLSLMSQYTPDFCDEKYKELKRRITTFEYNSVLDHAIELGYDGYFQELSSSKSSYTPIFTEEKIYDY